MLQLAVFDIFRLANKTAVKPPNRGHLVVYVRSHAGPPGGSMGLVSGGLLKSVGFYRPPGTSRSRFELDPLTRELPVDEAQSLNLILDMAPRLGYTIEVIDVSAEGYVANELERELQRDERYPILLSPGGAQLVGPEWFTPGNLKRFLVNAAASPSSPKLRSQRK